MDYIGIHGRNNLLQADDTEEFRMTLRMPKPVYDELLELVRPLITKRTTNFRAPIPADQRLALTLRFLAFGKIYCYYLVIIKIPSFRVKLELRFSNKRFAPPITIPLNTY